jgi:hypothetical protein
LGNLPFLELLLFQRKIELVKLLHELESKLTGLEIMFLFFLLVDIEMRIEIGQFFLEKLFCLGKTIFSGRHLPRMILYHLIDVLIVLILHFFLGSQNLF